MQKGLFFNDGFQLGKTYRPPVGDKTTGSLLSPILALPPWSKWMLGAREEEAKMGATVCDCSLANVDYAHRSLSSAIVIN